MAKAEPGAVRPPNQALQGLAATTSGPARAGTPPTRAGTPPTRERTSNPDGGPGGSADLTRRPSQVTAANHRFNVASAKMPQPPAAAAPGPGMIPTSPVVPSVPRAVPLRPIANVANGR